MCKKAFILLVSICFLTLESKADYIHGIGLGYDIFLGGGSGGISAQYLGRLNYARFSEGNMSLGFAFTPSMGYSMANSGAVIGLAISPIEFSFGPAATKDAKSKVGFGVSPIVSADMYLVSGGIMFGGSAGANAAFRFAAGNHPMSINFNYLFLNASSLGIRYAYYF